MSFNMPMSPVMYAPPREFRSELAGYAQRHRMSIEYRSWNVGLEHQPSWVSAVFLNGIEYGRGQSNTSKGRSMERAASQAMAVIERPRYHH
ncbi:hypothetical protein C8J56DRAFT_1169010 [Mycena floridula]|nr:hypothetical protein C8J56DRAFT_1169010 [Mycena floridula]